MSKQSIKDGAASAKRQAKGLVELTVTFADLAAAYVLLTQGDRNVALMVVGAILAAHGIALAANKFTK